MEKKQLRDYQIECLETIKTLEPGNYLICMATGLGKTFTFSRLEELFQGNILILSHRDALVKQPKKYFNSRYGIEMGNKKSAGERIISASVQSLKNDKRLNKFAFNHFEVIIVDEAHHAPAPSYQKILSYFHGAKYVFGFTATPNRGDKIGLQKTYSKIIFNKSLKWGIENNYLCGINCKTVDIGYDLRGVKTTAGDFNAMQLNLAVNIEQANKAIADIYFKMAVGKTLIFAVNKEHCKSIKVFIAGSEIIDDQTSEKERDRIINNFENGDLNCLINCMVLTEGTDIPCIETIIWARPTKNSSLYTQGVGRGLRKFPGKDKLLLIDCVGSVNNCDLCTAPTLLGLKLDNVKSDKLKEIEGNLFQLELQLIEITDNPHSWIKNIKTVNLWGKSNNYDTHNINYMKMPNGDFILNIPGLKFMIPVPDELGNVNYNGKYQPIQKIFDKAYNYLIKNFGDKRCLWDTKIIEKWGKAPATPIQLTSIQKKLKDFDTKDLTKLEAALILNRLNL